MLEPSVVIFCGVCKLLQRRQLYLTFLQRSLLGFELAGQCHTCGLGLHLRLGRPLYICLKPLGLKLVRGLELSDCTADRCTGLQVIR